MRLSAALITVLALTTLGQAPAVAGNGTAGASVTVLELFTSQGCSSCPPADALFHTYAKRPDLIALSMPVDYWDHLGWKDTLANPRHTARQRAYARSLGTGNIYTPQIVVGGTAQAIGSIRSQVDSAIARSREVARSGTVAISSQLDGAGYTIEIGKTAGGGTATAVKLNAPATVWFAIVAPRVDVRVQRGENRGRILTYYNVVRAMTPIGMYSGQAVTLKLPPTAAEGSTNSCAVFVQQGDAGRIIGAAWIKR